jgi:hypothetical protein
MLEIAEDAFTDSDIIIIAPEGSYAVEWAEDLLSYALLSDRTRSLFSSLLLRQSRKVSPPTLFQRIDFLYFLMRDDIIWPVAILAIEKLSTLLYK